MIGIGYFSFYKNRIAYRRWHWSSR